MTIREVANQILESDINHLLKLTQDDPRSMLHATRIISTISMRMDTVLHTIDLLYSDETLSATAIVELQTLLRYSLRTAIINVLLLNKIMYSTRTIELLNQYPDHTIAPLIHELRDIKNVCKYYVVRIVGEAAGITTYTPTPNTNTTLELLVQLYVKIINTPGLFEDPDSICTEDALFISTTWERVYK